MDPLLHGHGGDSDPHSSSPFDNLKPSVLIIFLILIISVFICFFLRYLSRRGHRRHSLSSSTSAPAVTSDSRILSDRRVVPETTAPSVLNSLPVFKFSTVTRRSSSDISGDCAVCLSKFEPHDQLRLLPLCCHAFHADCIDTWLVSNRTCPLCRSPPFAAESDLMKALSDGENSFRLEIGSISRLRPTDQDSGEQQTSYSIGSFDYIVDDDESEVSVNDIRGRSIPRKDEDAIPVAVAVSPYESSLAGEVGGGSSNWLKDYVDRFSSGLSSRTLSLRSSERFFTGSNRQTDDIPSADVEADPAAAGEEISELFRWLSGM